VIAIGKEGEEFDKEDSYFPYMRELKLSKRSPYSSTGNENVHNWIHFFCALLGSDRSYNARIVNESGLTIMMNLALFAAYAFKKFSTPQFAFGNQGEADETKIISGLDEASSRGEIPIDSSSLLGIFRHMMENDNSVPLEIKTMFGGFISRMPTRGTRQ